MSKICEICGKKPLFGHNVSHSHRKTKRNWLPNIQKAKISVDGKETTVKICTKCLKAQSKVKKVASSNGKPPKEAF
ncbi:MAG: 50S ribosomal protein L28 [Patescibacteria group bacterium]|nr:50S ribosomal protein L28 [Patescibacteria group bacterium]